MNPKLAADRERVGTVVAVEAFHDLRQPSFAVEWAFVAGPDFSTALAELDKALTSIEAVVDPTKKAGEITDLEKQVAAPNLWDDPENAQRVTSRLSAARAEVDRVTGLRSRLDDLAVLVELAQDEEDAASLAEADAEL